MRPFPLGAAAERLSSVPGAACRAAALSFPLSDPDGGLCRRTYCGRGRQCLVLAETGRAECVCQEKCRPSFVPVCGSDGRFYENHCEVYRTACLEKRRIYVVHSKELAVSKGIVAPWGDSVCLRVPKKSQTWPTLLCSERPVDPYPEHSRSIHGAGWNTPPVDLGS
ncbi:unnamed protein product [Boreogadus saida]